jgi:hypothetical protein
MLGATVAGAVTGCLEDSTGTPADRGSATPGSGTALQSATPDGPTPTDTGGTATTGTPTAGTNTAGTQTATPPSIDIETPEPGECETPPRPDPSTGEGLPDPRSYPDPPDRIEPAPVRSYLEAYEGAYRYNERLADLAEDDACVEYFETYVEGSTVWRTDRGIVGKVVTRGSYTGTTCSETSGTDTATPPPHADFFSQPAHYLVTDRFLVLAGTVVECWE